MPGLSRPVEFFPQTATSFLHQLGTRREAIQSTMHPEHNHITQFISQKQGFHQNSSRKGRTSNDLTEVHDTHRSLLLSGRNQTFPNPGRISKYAKNTTK